MIDLLLQFILLIILPFWLAGVINRIKAWWAGRQGPPLLQPLYDFLKLARKGRVISSTSSWVFAVYPAVTTGAALAAGLLLPLPGRPALFSFSGDIVVFAYLFSLSRFAAIIGAMDTGSSFEGLGASRDALFSGLAEPPLLVIGASLALLTRRGSLPQISMQLASSGQIHILLTMLAVAALFIMILVEGCRVPIDDPNTHLELTMIHEVMILDNSGPDLAMLSYCAHVKMVIIATLAAGLFVTRPLPLGLALLMSVIATTLTAVAVGWIESIHARVRLAHIPQFIFVMSSLALAIFSTVALFTLGKWQW